MCSMVLQSMQVSEIGRIICRVCFVAFLEERTYLGLLPMSRYYSTVERCLKDYVNYRCNFLA